MPSDNLDELTQNYGTFGKKSAQREPTSREREGKPATPATPAAPAKKPTSSVSQAEYNFNHASDWLNRKTEIQASPKLAVKPTVKRAAPKPVQRRADDGPKPAAKKVAANVPLGAPDDGSV